MNTANHLLDEDLALFGLQLLPEQEVAESLVHLEHCEACRQEVGRFQGDLATYAMTSELHSPPALARERLLRRVSKEKKINLIERVPYVAPAAVAATGEDGEPLLAARNSRVFEMEPHEEAARRRTPMVLAWVGWALAACLAVAVGLEFHQWQLMQSNLNSETAQLTRANTAVKQAAQAQDVMQTLTDTSAMQVALHRPAPVGVTAAAAAAVSAAPAAHVTYVPENGSLVFVASNLIPLPPYKTYELWVLPLEAGRDPVPAGTFKPDANGNANVVLPDLPKGVLAKGFGVTIEDDGGAAQPTMPIVLGM